MPITQQHGDYVRKLIVSGVRSRAALVLKKMHPADIADLFGILTPQEATVLVEILFTQKMADKVLMELPEGILLEVIERLEDNRTAELLLSLESNDALLFLEAVPEERRDEIMQLLPPLKRDRIEQLLIYPEDSAGGLMNPDVVTVRPDVSLDVVLRYLRLRGELPEVFDQLFVVDRVGKYLGQLKLSDVLTKEPSSQVIDLIDSSEEAIPVDMPASQVAIEFEHDDLISAPVIDQNGLLLGRITIDDVVDVIREEGEHMILTAAGLDEEDDMFAPVLQSARRRWLWLGVNLVTALMAALVLYAFQPTLDQLVELAVLFPVVMSMGGIAGTQTLTLMVRGMATGQVSARNSMAILRKELAVGILNGIVFSIVVATIAFLWYGNAGLGLVMAIAIIVNLVAGALAGALIPVFLKRMSIDPALAGGVVLTTVTDVVGIFAFIGLASYVLLAN